MAKNIVLKNALGDDVTYEGVSKIVLKDETGSNVEYIERPYTTSGVPYKPSAYLCRLFDYNGDIIKSEYLFPGEVFSLPDESELPVHNRLVRQGYSSPVEIVNNAVTVENQDINIGIVYTTVSGLSEFDITLTKATGLSITFRMSGNKDWGDGTSDSSTAHTYADYGNYTITCDGTVVSGYAFGQSAGVGSSNYWCIHAYLGSLVTSTSNYPFRNCKSLTEVTFSNSLTSILSGCFNDCSRLTGFVFPSGFTSIPDSHTFYACSAMKAVALPKGITSISKYTFANCYNLNSITIPNGVTQIGDTSFSSCAALTHINLPDSVTTIDAQAFISCTNLRKIIIGSKVSSIGDYAFGITTGEIEYDFTSHTFIPTISSFTFANSGALTKIYVPDNLYNDWIIATNWASFQQYIYKASEKAV